MINRKPMKTIVLNIRLIYSIATKSCQQAFPCSRDPPARFARTREAQHSHPALGHPGTKALGTSSGNAVTNPFQLPNNLILTLIPIIVIGFLLIFTLCVSTYIY